MIYRFDRASGKLSPAKQPFAELKAGAGPRHLSLHPTGKYLYVINELDSTMTAFKYSERGRNTHNDRNCFDVAERLQWDELLR